MLALLVFLAQSANGDRETLGPANDPPAYFVEVSSANGLGKSDIDGLARELGRAIQIRTGKTVEIRFGRSDLLDSEAIVRLRIHGAVTQIGLFAERGGGAPRSNRSFVPYQAAAWPDRLKAVAEALFDAPSEEPLPIGGTILLTKDELGERLALTPPPAEELAPPGAQGPGALLWVTWGASTALGVFGAWYGITHANEASRLDAASLDDPSDSRLSEQADDERLLGTLGYLTLTVGAAALAGSFIAWLATQSDPEDTEDLPGPDVLHRVKDEKRRTDLIRGSDPSGPTKAFDSDETIHRSKDPKPR